LIEYVRNRLTQVPAVRLPIEHEHALGVAQLPPYHRDPFDRVLVAQS
jgi:PIN domain nuclease of toxin-antitoxin system